VGALTGLALHARVPELAQRWRRRSLGELPSPLEAIPSLCERWGLRDLWVKREALIKPGLAGNKVRSLELLVGENDRSLLSFGPVGSNWARAVVRTGVAAGRPVDLVLWRGAVNAAGSGALAADRGLARRVTQGSALRGLLATLAGLMQRPRACVLLPGGASVAGVFANATAALECCAQCGAAERPPPDRVYVPWGSGTTAAGLAVGFALAGAQTQVVAVRVTSMLLANRVVVRSLIRSATRALRRAGVPAPRVKLRTEGRFMGPGYGRPSEAGVAAARCMTEATSLRLDPTYGAKAMAALQADAQAGRLQGRSAAFWLTIQEAAACAS